MASSAPASVSTLWSYVPCVVSATLGIVSGALAHRAWQQQMQAQQQQKSDKAASAAIDDGEEGDASAPTSFCKNGECMAQPAPRIPKKTTLFAPALGNRSAATRVNLHTQVAHCLRAALLYFNECSWNEDDLASSSTLDLAHLASQIESRWSGFRAEYKSSMNSTNVRDALAAQQFVLMLIQHDTDASRVIPAVSQEQADPTQLSARTMREWKAVRGCERVVLLVGADAFYYYLIDPCAPGAFSYDLKSKFTPRWHADVLVAAEEATTTSDGQAAEGQQQEQSQQRPVLHVLSPGIVIGRRQADAGAGGDAIVPFPQSRLQPLQ